MPLIHTAEVGETRMNRLERALGDLTELDELAGRSSPIHALHPTAKLVATLAYIAFTLSFDKYDLTGLVPMLLWPALLFQISGVGMKTCFHKLRFVLPLVMAVGLFNPFFDRSVALRLGGLAITGGVISMLTLMLKGVLCLCATFLLIATTPIDRLCAALRQLHMPKLLVTLLLLTYRYAGVMTRELAIMTDAYHLRAPGQRGIHISAWGSFLGQLLLRSMDRAQELYASMLLRGYDQQFHYAALGPFGARDALYGIASIAAFALLRFVPVTRLLGDVLVR